MRVPFKHTRAALLLALVAGLAVATVQAQDRHDQDRPGFDRAHEHIDARFHSNHAYPNRGVVVHALPARHYDVAFGGAHYFFAGGVWYAPRAGAFVVIAPPIGLFAPILPPFYTTVWFGGIPYYYADDVYYVYRGPVTGYEVVAPPPGAEVADAPPPGAPPPPGAAPAPPPPQANEQLFIYPKNGQSPDQQAKDRYECHTWASSQTAFDPTAVNGGVPPSQTANARADYNRAMDACLEGRGYTVR